MNLFIFESSFFYRKRYAKCKMVYFGDVNGEGNRKNCENENYFDTRR